MTTKGKFIASTKIDNNAGEDTPPLFNFSFTNDPLNLQNIKPQTMETQTTPQSINVATLLYDFAHQRPCLSPCDYGGGREGWLAYRRESAEITRDLNDFRELFTFAFNLYGGKFPELVADYLAKSSDRLTLKGDKLEYITGQYFPTEYRPASSRCLVSLIWRYYANRQAENETGGDIRKAIRRRLSRRVGRLYFN